MHTMRIYPSHTRAHTVRFTWIESGVCISSDPSILSAGEPGLIPNMVFDANFDLLAQFAA
jgi:hypothetical protein